MSAGLSTIHTTIDEDPDEPEERRCRQCCEWTDEYVLCHVCNGPVCRNCAKTIDVNGLPADVHERWCYKGQNDDD